MTRLEAFAERLTLEMLNAWNAISHPSAAEAAARLVAERLIREFALNCTDESLGSTVHAGRWLDEPEKP